MKFKLSLTIPIIFFFCTKNNVENEIQENIKLIEKLEIMRFLYFRQGRNYKC